jgi:putative methyltransferase (TIGR01177 family)
LTSKSLVLLSGEPSTVPTAEARALFLAYDPSSRFESPEPRVLIAESSADPVRVGARIAFARRVGALIEEQGQLKQKVRGRKVRFRGFDLRGEGAPFDPGSYLRGLDATVDLQDPDSEVTLVRGTRDYLAVTTPGQMEQRWALRRPRNRPFFHPSAIFPKLSRALVNLSRCREGDVFLDPFAGTGSVLLEAHQVGARVVAVDLADKMVRGSISNMKHFSQDWLGVIRADAARLPIRMAQAIATDIPYGRASSTRGRAPTEMVDLLFPSLISASAPGCHFVVMHPQDVPVAVGRELRVLEEHHLHVHKLLTRTITVLERR